MTVIASRLASIDQEWATALEPVSPQIAAMESFLRDERSAGRRYLPADVDVLRAFAQPFDEVRVLFVGQDPYPTPGHPIGLSFAVERHVQPLPHSLENIYRELRDDLGVEPPEHGDLSAWSRQGVLLLNRCLTVAPDQPGSHHGKGWKAVTDHAIGALVARGGPLVAILLGADAHRLRSLLGSVPSVACGHPSPRSADRGFFGSRPFSRANALLAEQGAPPIDWSLR